MWIRYLSDRMLSAVMSRIPAVSYSSACYVYLAYTPSYTPVRIVSIRCSFEIAYLAAIVRSPMLLCMLQ
jgi:hypothetical protein